MRSHCYHWTGRLWLGLLVAWLTLSARADLASLFTNLNGHAASTTGRPRLSSIIFIQCDGLGYLDLSCYGQKQFSTPNLDRLAAGGMLFTNYDAQGADGPTASAALLLGQAPGKSYLTPDEPTVAQILKAAGYHTGLIGEWDFGGPETGNAPWQKGFDEFAGYFDPADAENYYADFISRYAPLAHLNPTNNQFETYIGRTELTQNAGGARKLYIPDLYAQAAAKFIKINRPYYANHYQPFFLWLNYSAPRPSQAETARTGNGIVVPTDAPFSEEPWPQPEKNRAALITRLDEGVGQVMNQLRAVGMTNNVAVFFASATVPRKAGGVDPVFFPSVTDTNDARLPLIAYWPRHIPTNQVCAAHLSPGDFLATAAQIAMTRYPTNDVQPSVLRVLFGLPATSAPAKN